MAKPSGKKKKWSRSGETMVEIIVSFALIAIFAVAATTVITSAVRLYYEIKAEDNGTQAANVIMEKIAGEISAAKNVSSTDQIILSKTQEGNSIIFFMDRSDTPVFITSATKTQCATANSKENSEENGEENFPLFWILNMQSPAGEATFRAAPVRLGDNTGDHYLLMYYYKLENEGNVVYQQVAWTFDDAVYYGYHIEKLNFTKASAENNEDGVTAPQYAKNVIKIELTLKNDHYSKEYSTTRYVECYNFTEDSDFQKIVTIE